MNIYLYYIGKPRSSNANAMAADFIKRAAHYSKCEMCEIQPKTFDVWAKHPSARKILLDPRGKCVDSSQFTQLISVAESHARDMVFVIGGAEGLPAGWPARADMLLSLSPLTFPHELARVMLAEQIYRAFAKLRGHPYPK